MGNGYIKSNIVIMAVTMMDFVTAMLVLINPHPLLVARLGIFYEFFTLRYAYIGALLMFAAITHAIYGMLQSSPIKRFLLFIPQQIFLLMTTGSAVDYIVMQHYADGVMRPWQFILQDQLPSIILTVVYFFAILDFRQKVS